MRSTLHNGVHDRAFNGFRISLSRRHKLALVTIVNLTCFFVLWEVYAMYGNVPSIFLPKFSSVVKSVAEMQAEGILLPNLWVSFSNFIIGLVIGVAIGLPLAFVIGGIKTLDRVLSPYLWALFATPRIILVPIMFLWFGISNAARLAIIIITVVPALAVVVMEGLKTTDATLIRAAKVFGANRRRLFTHVIFPCTIPSIGTGLRMAMLRGMIALFVAELFIVVNGLGSIIAYSRTRFLTPRIFAAVLIFTLFAVSGLYVTRYIETKLMAWRVVR